MNKGDLLQVKENAKLRDETGCRNGEVLNEQKVAIYLETIEGWEGKQRIWNNLPTNMVKWFLVLIDGKRYIVPDNYVVQCLPALSSFLSFL